MSLSRDELVARMHAHPLRLVLAVTGGGSLAMSDLLAVPGASRTVLAAHVPYAEAALTQWLGSRPEHACSGRTARAMAMTAWQEARELVPQTDETSGPLAGIGCTASLASDRPKRGPHRVHVAVQTLEQTAAWELLLNKGARSRAAEERLAADLILKLMAAQCEFAEEFPLELLGGENIAAIQATAQPGWRELLTGQAAAVAALSAGAESTIIASRQSAVGPPRVIFPGAFNPLHDGHIGMAECAAQRLGRPVEYELSVVNVDKPPLDYVELQARVAQFGLGQRLWLTRAATFVDKALLFPGARFVVGIDTLERIGQVRYYRGDLAQRDRAIDALQHSGARFLVFCRTCDGQLSTLDSVELPPALSALCDAVPADEFCRDVSSTALRRAAED